MESNLVLPHNELVDAAYCDGGCIGSVRSYIGGTWAWCHIKIDDMGHEHLVTGASGVIKPSGGMTSITNNYSEYVAMVRCLQALPTGWEGTLYSDSEITLGRLFKGHSLMGIPEGLYRKAEDALARLSEVRPVLVSGHPTIEELKAGRCRAHGRIVSRWNVWCDEMAHTAGTEYASTLPTAHEAGDEALDEAVRAVERRMGT
jgi:ribonuclease HI